MVDVVQEATEVDGAVSVRVSGGGMEGGIEVGEGTPYLEFTVRLYGEAISDLIAVVDVQPSRTEPAPDLEGLQAAVLSMIRQPRAGERERRQRAASGADAGVAGLGADQCLSASSTWASRWRATSPPSNS